MRHLSLTSALAGALLSLAAATSTPAADPQRFFPADLQQDGRVTLFPAFSPDGATLYISQSEGTPIWRFPQRLKRSNRTATGWSEPVRVDLGEDARVDGASVSPDGRTLYFSWAPDKTDGQGRTVREDFDLYRLDLTRDDAVPEALENQNRLRAGRVATLRYVNNEGTPSVDANGRLYFFSERLDEGPGERDLFVSEPEGDGFAAPRPHPLSTSGREGTPWITADGQRLFYAQAGACGGSDLFVSRREGDGWSAPRNLGCDVNSPASEFGPRLSPAGDLLFTSDRAFADTPEGLYQVWWVQGWDADQDR